MKFTLKDIEILIPKKDKNRLDSVFYPDQETIARLDLKNGYELYAWVCGDVRIIDKKTDEEYRNHNYDELWDLTDKQLSSERYVWENNNWFEISGGNQKTNEMIDLMELEYDYDSALEHLVELANNEDRDKRLGIVG